MEFKECLYNAVRNTGGPVWIQELELVIIVGPFQKAGLFNPVIL